MDILDLHHVSIRNADVARARDFYVRLFGLTDIHRPASRTNGVWLGVGAQQLHLIESSPDTLRQSPKIDMNDAHFAIRVRDFDAAVARLEANGFRRDAAEDDPQRLLVTHHRGFPQGYVLDPDRNIVEINGWPDGPVLL
jgi:catechol 2,3-dioxygenase-like lactoylglutathione lyase family enzyme